GAAKLAAAHAEHVGPQLGGGPLDAGRAAGGSLDGPVAPAAVDERDGLGAGGGEGEERGEERGGHGIFGRSPVEQEIPRAVRNRGAGGKPSCIAPGQVPFGKTNLPEVASKNGMASSPWPKAS